MSKQFIEHDEHKHQLSHNLFSLCILMFDFIQDVCCILLNSYMITLTLVRVLSIENTATKFLRKLFYIHRILFKFFSCSDRFMYLYEITLHSRIIDFAFIAQISIIWFFSNHDSLLFDKHRQCFHKIENVVILIID